MTCPLCRGPMTAAPLLAACATAAPPSGTVYSCAPCDYAMATTTLAGATIELPTPTRPWLTA